jgi:hypothetical protein
MDETWRAEIALPIEGSSRVVRKDAWGLTEPPNMANRTCRRAALITSLLASGLASIALPSWAGEGSSCMPARPGSEPSTLPAAWRAAFDALIVATAREGLPWSCPGGMVELAVASAEGPGVLTVTDVKGRRTTRPVASPADVGPTGKALLAAPLTTAPVVVAAAPIAAPAAAVPSPPRTEAPVVAPADPRLVLGVMAGPRLSGPDRTAWMSASLRGAIPIGPWSLGLWTRLDLPVAMKRPASPYFSMSSLSVGLNGGRSFAAGPIVLDALLAPSVAVVSMEAERDEVTPPHNEGARVMLRIGAELGASARLNGWLRGRIALDGEVAPSSAALIAEGFPRAPRYMMGLSLGLEAVLH